MCSANRRLPVLILILSLLCPAASAAPLVPTRRDTKPAPPAMAYAGPSLHAYELLYETGGAAYYWREDRDIFAVLDKANGYVWKTGADIGFSRDIKKAVEEAKTEEEKLLAAEPVEKSMNSTYIGVANSLITIEYRDGKTFYLGSAAEKGAVSTLRPIPGEAGRFLLEADFQEIDLQIEVQVTLLEKGLRYDVPASGIRGAGRAVFTALWLTPFLGASGGEAEFYDPVTGDYGDARPKYAVPGYALVPDGSGALIRFQDNSVPFVEYTGDVYGMDPATETYYYQMDTDALALRDPLAPVFGIAHGDRQAAFVAYAEKGAEYLDIVMRPEENLRLKYNFCYPRFEYNVEYYKVYNRKGSGYFAMGENLFDYDVRMTYEFLHGDGTDGSPAADYTGMALAYRRHLIQTGVLKERPALEGDIPLRLDFILSDMKRSLIGHEQVVCTTAGDVGAILDEVLSLGITNVSSGLIGWQSGAETLARPDRYSFSGRVGKAGDFEALIRRFADKGVDVSLARNFSLLNSRMTSYLGTAAKHINTWYIAYDRSALYEGAPVTDFSFALPSVAGGWLTEIARRAQPFSDSLTVSGLTRMLTSSYDRRGVTLTLGDSVAAYRNALAEAAQGLQLNLETPNLYLWEYASRFLQAPVGGSQYVFQTDDVPFLQMVLRGTMEVYGPYCNFSFYTREDVLRMIDYNVSPSFILSRQPSHLLTDTLSADLYSTEFEQYRELVMDIYGQVNGVLSKVQGMRWTGRTVPENGLAVNEYRDGDGAVQVGINYTDSPLTYQGREIPPKSAVVLEGVAVP